jgi:predicted dehydrogenase
MEPNLPAAPIVPPKDRKIHCAVVGLGHIAQSAVLPGFRHAENSELTAIVSGDPVKLKKLKRRYRLEHRPPVTEPELVHARSPSGD